MKTDKINREIYISPEPIEIDVIDQKYFDNTVDFKRFIEKHRKTLAYSKIEYYVIREDNEIEFESDYLSAPHYNIFDEIITNIAEKTINTITDYGITVYWNHRRLENKEETKKRLELVKSYNALHTRQLLAQHHYKHYNYDSLAANVMKAILDTREHIPVGKEQKKIRQEKAKQQRTR